MMRVQQGSLLGSYYFSSVKDQCGYKAIKHIAVDGLICPPFIAYVVFTDCTILDWPLTAERGSLANGICSCCTLLMFLIAFLT